MTYISRFRMIVVFKVIFFATNELKICINCGLYIFFFHLVFCRKQKSKAFLALQALETDLNSLAQLQRSV